MRLSGRAIYLFDPSRTSATWTTKRPSIFNRRNVFFQMDLSGGFIRNPQFSIIEIPFMANSSAFNLEEHPAWSTERTLSLWNFLLQRLLHVYLLFYQFLVCFTQFSHIPFSLRTHTYYFNFFPLPLNRSLSITCYLFLISVGVFDPDRGGMWCDAIPPSTPKIGAAFVKQVGASRPQNPKTLSGASLCVCPFRD